MTAPWITYRPELKVLDCTIRDGGLINDHQFDDGFVKKVYETCVAAGVDYMELGYKNSKKLFSPSQFGPWKHTDEDSVRRIVEDNPSDLKLSAMADADRRPPSIKENSPKISPGRMVSTISSFFFRQSALIAILMLPS